MGQDSLLWIVKNGDLILTMYFNCGNIRKSIIYIWFRGSNEVYDYMGGAHVVLLGPKKKKTVDVDLTGSRGQMVKILNEP